MLKVNLAIVKEIATGKGEIDIFFEFASGPFPRGLPRLSSLRRKSESRKEDWIPDQARNDT